MAKESWDLNWDQFTAPQNLKVEQNVKCLLVQYEDNETVKKASEHLNRWLVKGRFRIYENGECVDDSPRSIPNVTASKGDEKIRCCYDWNRCVIMLQNEKSKGEIVEVICGQLKANRIYTAEVHHGVREFKLGEMDGIVYTGLNTLDEGDCYPYKFYFVRMGQELIAKALVGHYNIEMGEMAPTIEAIEVVQKMRGKGVAKSFLEFIEGEAWREGFPRIWADNTSENPKFWMNNGYSSDGDEAWKDLEDE